MVLIHTADWHIGQNFYGYDRYEEHRHFFAWLADTLVAQRADVLLVTGDVFDGPNPPAKAQHLYYAFLREVGNRLPNLQVIITAGNHDSAARLEAPAPLLETMNVTVVGSVHYGEAEGLADTDAALAGAAARMVLPLLGASGEVEACCVAVPYLRQGDYPSAATYDEGVQKLYTALAGAARRQAGGKPVVMTGHLHVLGATVSERDRSERVVVGGLDCVSDAIFPPDVAYGALGHLHRAQRVAGRDAVRYAGAPIPMSFAEKRNAQSVCRVELSERGVVAIDLLPYEPKVALWSVPEKPGTIDDVLAALAGLPQGEVTDGSPYLEIKVQMFGPDPTMRYKIEKALQGKSVRLTAILPFYPAKAAGEASTGGDGAGAATAQRTLSQIPPLGIAQEVYRKKYGVEMPEALQKLMSDVIKEVEA